jgi:hypothetical protein
MDLNGLRDKALGLVHGHKDQVEDGVDKVAEAAKGKLGHDDTVDKAADFIKDNLDKA